MLTVQSCRKLPAPESKNSGTASILAACTITMQVRLHKAISML